MATDTTVYTVCGWLTAGVRTHAPLYFATFSHFKLEGESRFRKNSLEILTKFWVKISEIKNFGDGSDESYAWAKVPPDLSRRVALSYISRTAHFSMLHYKRHAALCEEGSLRYPPWRVVGGSTRWRLPRCALGVWVCRLSRLVAEAFVCPRASRPCHVLVDLIHVVHVVYLKGWHASVWLGALASINAPQRHVYAHSRTASATHCS